jgi:formylglycine-generating enzyme required for sulfatase activity
MELSLPLLTFEFETVCVDEFGDELYRDRNEAQSFRELLGSGTYIEMVMLLGGEAKIGSPLDEKDRMPDEDDPYLVTFESFCVSKYPVTQSQWRAVASLPKVSRDLEADPSIFKGLNRPVESVSWFDAVEFCNRLSIHTQRTYRLPTEAEWEYACRAGTTTPFHYGDTLTSAIANYRCQNHGYQNRRDHGRDHPKKSYHGTYAQESAGRACEETTDVGSYRSANAFGLYDLHGNVWEWCAKNEWEPSDDTDYPYQQPARGGSWKTAPAGCRSSFNLMFAADSQDASVGFRVVYSASGDHVNNKNTLQSVQQSVLSNVNVYGGNINIGDINQSVNKPQYLNNLNTSIVEAS